MRISGGAARGITLRVPKGDVVRPATDGMRQALFSSLGARVAGARFLDLFAGSGAYGLEAFSRGAASGCFVEQNARAVACLRQNIAAVGKSVGRETAALQVLQADARTVPAPGEMPDLVFIDPPYELIPSLVPPLFARLRQVLGAQPEALVLLEAPGELELAADGWQVVKRLGKGTRQPTVTIFRQDTATPPT